MPRIEMNFHEIILNYDKSDDDLEYYYEDDVENCMICLPIIDDGKAIQQNGKGLYYVIAAKWTKMDLMGI